MVFPILPANTLSTGAYDIANSCRFSGNTYLRIDSGENASTRAIFTLSFWIKRGTLSGEAYSNEYLFTSNDVGGSNHVKVYFSSDNSLTLELKVDGSTTTIDTSRLFRDRSAWYHIVIAVDSTQGTSANRVDIYVNGVKETAFDTEQYPAEDAEFEWFNDTEVMTIGARTAGDRYFDGYMADIAIINVTTGLTASTFGETDEDSGIWKPKKITQSFSPTNSCYLEFKQSGTGQDSSGIGADTGGNDKHFAVTNLTAVDQCTDTPTNNWCTFNPLDVSGVDNPGELHTYSEGNTKIVHETGDNVLGWAASTIGLRNGKWYFEIKLLTVGHQVFGVGPNSWDGQDGSHANVFHVYVNNGAGKWRNESGENSISLTEANNDIWMFALDLDSPKWWIGHNGTWLSSGDPAAGSNPLSTSAITDTVFIKGSLYAEDRSLLLNTGNPSFEIASGNADDNGYGNFEYDVPSGFYAICTKNLAEYG